jgi:trimethylamine---corrinoid protein Co-methyltransferase
MALHPMKLNTMEVLSRDDIEQIHEATVDILAGCGVKVHSARTLDLMASKGLSVDREQQVVWFGKPAIEDAIARIPRMFDVFDREGKFAFTLGDGSPRVAAGHNAVFWGDTETGETRT